MSAVRKMLKPLSAALCVCVALGSAHPQTTELKASQQAGNRMDQQDQVQLSTTILNQQYCFDGDSRRLQLALRLTFRNVGTIPILLDKASSTIDKTLISRNVKAANARKYVDESSYYYNLRKVGVREALPAKSFFITLNPNEAYSIDTDLGLLLYDGTKDSRDDLYPGSYFLQINVWTWYYPLPPKTYREEWREQGLLWSKTTTSQPMPFTVVKQVKVADCLPR